jgi:aryl-alcohol dehydrogenase-like predicted oxidoreductase
MQATRPANSLFRPAPGRKPSPVCWAGAAERVTLGSSDLSVSKCCLGTMTWGQQNTEAEAHEQLDYALESGINFIDTAEIYPVPPVAETQGRTDRYIGSWFASRGTRNDVVLATKVSGYGRQSYLRADGSNPRVNEANVVESVDASLQRLGVDHIDLLQVHWPDRYVPLFGAKSYDVSMERPDDIPFEEQLRALQKVVDAGKVRYVGVSNETSYGVMRFCQLAESAGLPRIQTIQNSYSLMTRSLFETDLAEVCAPRQCNVSLLAYSPLAGVPFRENTSATTTARGRTVGSLCSRGTWPGTSRVSDGRQWSSMSRWPSATA